MYKFKDEFYEKKYVASGGGNIVAYFIFPDINLGKFMDTEQNYNFCFGKLGKSLKSSPYNPVILDETNAHELCDKCINSYLNNWSLCDTFCIFGMIIAKFVVDDSIVESITETSFDQYDGSIMYDADKMDKPFMIYKAQSSHLKRGLISFDVMKKLKQTPYELFYHVDDRLKSCFNMFNLLDDSFKVKSYCLKILQILYTNKNTFVSIDKMDTQLHKPSLQKSLVDDLILQKKMDVTGVVVGGKRRTKKQSKKHSKSKSKKHSKSKLQKGGSTDIIMKKKYDDLVKEYYMLKKQAKSKNII
jgi:hypothetical protein